MSEAGASRPGGGFLARLAARTDPGAPALAPRLRARFEASAPSLPLEAEGKEVTAGLVAAPPGRPPAGAALSPEPHLRPPPPPTRPDAPPSPAPDRAAGARTQPREDAVGRAPEPSRAAPILAVSPRRPPLPAAPPLYEVSPETSPRVLPPQAAAVPPPADGDAQAPAGPSAEATRPPAAPRSAALPARWAPSAPAPLRDAARSPSPETVVRIEIGRVEVRAVAPPRPAAPAVPRTAEPSRLEAYLAGRRPGR